MNPADRFDVIDVLRWGVRWVQRPFSSVGVTATEVKVRNFPSPTRTYSVSDVDRFDWHHDELHDVGLLRLRDGRTIPVCALDPRRPGSVTDLNNRLGNRHLTR